MAISSVFQPRRWTCHEPRAKAVMGIMARIMRPGPCLLRWRTILAGASRMEIKSGSSILSVRGRVVEKGFRGALRRARAHWGAFDEKVVVRRVRNRLWAAFIVVVALRSFRRWES